MWLKDYNIKILFVDAMIVVGVFLLASLIRFGTIIFPPINILLFCGIIVILMLANLFMQGLFDMKKISLIEILFKVGKAVSITFLLYATLAYFDWTFRLPRTIIGLLWFFSIPALTLIHFLFRPNIIEKKNIIIIDGSKKSKVFYKLLKDERDSMILGHVGKKGSRLPIPWLGKIEELKNIIKKYRIKEILICSESDEEIFQILKQCYNLDVSLKITPDMTDFVLAGEIDNNGLANLTIRPTSTINLILKRASDFLVSLILIITLLPPMALIAILVKSTSNGPALFRQKRQGIHSEEFIVAKFRTMIKDAEKMTGPVISDNKTDKRITLVGRLLRRTHLDEIPQLFLILTGTMSFVGPRPERAKLSKKFKKELKQWDLRLYMKPGLTGLAQTEGITGLDPVNKIKRDLYYIKNQSFFLDTKILLKTIWYVLFGHN